MDNTPLYCIVICNSSEASQDLEKFTSSVFEDPSWPLIYPISPAGKGGDFWFPRGLGHNYAKASSEQRGVATSFRWGGSVSRFKLYSRNSRWVEWDGMVNMASCQNRKKCLKWNRDLYGLMESYGEFLAVIFAPMKKILDVVSFPESCWDYVAGAHQVRSFRGFPGNPRDPLLRLVKQNKQLRSQITSTKDRKFLLGTEIPNAPCWPSHVRKKL